MADLIYVKLDDFEPNPWQTRPVDEEAASRLAQDIRENGLIQPPAGRLMDDEEATVQLAVGHHRLAAFWQLFEADEDPAHSPWQRMPVQIGEYTDMQMAILAWSENYQRKNLTAIEEARAIQKAIDDFKWNQRQAAKHFGLARATVANKVRLLELPEEVQEANAEGRLSERQASALRPIADIQAKLNGNDLRWGINPMERWDAPVTPESYLSFVAENADTVSSEAIRDYTKKILNHAGEEIPGDLAITELNIKHDHIVQATCKGCSFRYNEYCLNKTCLEAKKKDYGLVISKAAAEELQLPWSNDKKHFKKWEEHFASKELLRAWKADTCEHLVIGWQEGGGGARLFSDDTYSTYISGDASFKDRAGVVLGCTHFPIGECAAPVEKAEEDEDPEDVDELEEDAARWMEAARLQRRELEERLIQALADGISLMYDVATLANGASTILWALAELKEAKGRWSGNGDIEALSKYLVRSAIESGRFVNYNHDSAYIFYPRAVEILTVAGLEPVEVLEQGYDEQEQLVRECNRLLGRWAERRRYNWQREDGAEEMEEPLAELRERVSEALTDDESPSEGDLMMAFFDLNKMAAEVQVILMEKRLDEEVEASKDEDEEEVVAV